MLDFSQVLAGPTATKLLVELGAEVIKIEFAEEGDPSRTLPRLQGCLLYTSQSPRDVEEYRMPAYA